MEVDKGKLRYDYSLWKAHSKPDGSVWLIKYKTNASAAELLTLKNETAGYYQPDNMRRFNLTVTLPDQRELEAVLVIIKSSANKFKLMYSDGKRSDLVTLGKYFEVNLYLTDCQKSFKG